MSSHQPKKVEETWHAAFCEYQKPLARGHVGLYQVEANELGREGGIEVPQNNYVALRAALVLRVVYMEVWDDA